MTRRNRIHSLLVRTVATLALLGGAWTPAWAQESIVVNEIDAAFRQADNARAAGNCLAHLEAVNETERVLIRLLPNLAIIVGAEEVRERAEAWNARLAAERARPCGSTPPEDATMADLPVTGPLGPALPPPPVSSPGEGAPEREQTRLRYEAELRAQGRFSLAEWRLAERLRFIDAAELALVQAERLFGTGDCAGMRNVLRGHYDNLRGASRGADDVEINELMQEITFAETRDCGPPSLGATTISIAGGFGESTLPRANYGFISDGTAGSERPAGFSRERIPMLMFEGSGEFRGIGRFTLGYRTGDARARTAVAPGTGTAQGVVGTDNAPSTSTGVAANLGVSVDTVTLLDEFFGRARFNLYTFGSESIGSEEEWARAQTRPSQFPASAGVMAPIRVPRRESRLSGRITAELFALNRDSDYLGTVSIAGTTGAGTPVSVVQTLDQEVRQIEVGVNVGIEATIPLSAGVRLTVGAQVGAVYYDYDGTSVEDRVQNVGPANDRAYRITLEDDESGIAYRGDAMAELAVDLSQPVQLFAGVSVSYNSVRGYWVNPSSGDFVLNGGTSFVDTASAVDWQVMAGLRFAFGQPPQR